MTRLFDPEFASPVEWAQAYRAAGLNVIPAVQASEKKKHPLGSWKEFQSGLTPDVVFDRWYGPGGDNVRNMSMGILTGPASLGPGEALLLVDIDVKDGKGGMETWRAWLDEHENGIEPETWRARTGSGGTHLYFRYPETLKIYNTQETFRGIDTRAEGGFVMAPPSPHYLPGQVYQWDVSPWDDVALADAPEWLIAICMQIGEQDTQRPRPMAEKVEAVEQVNAFGKKTDGREKYMRSVVWAALLDLYREAPIKPGRDESERHMLDAYNTYVRHVKTRLPTTNEEGLEREGRGLTHFQEKWDIALAKWDTDIKAEAAKPRPQTSDSFANAEELKPGYTPPDGLYEVLDMRAIKALPEPKWLVKGLAIEQALGFVYGPPGCLKTFICLDMALCLASARPAWWGRTIEKSGAVVYISSEGQSDLKHRIRAWEIENKVEVDQAPFFLIRQTINFMSPDDVGKLLATVEDIRTRYKVQLAAVFVDTVSRVLPGADENLQKDMTLFVTACDAVRQRFDTIVIGVHHTSRAGNMRGSTVFPGAGDFMLEVEREPGAKTGLIRAVKIKAAEDGWETPFIVADHPVGNLPGLKSLVVKPNGPTDMRAPKAKSYNDSQAMAMEALRDALATEGKQVTNNNIPASAKCIKNDLWKGIFYAKRGGEDAAAKRAFNRAKNDLIRMRDIGVWLENVWIVEP